MKLFLTLSVTILFTGIACAATFINIGTGSTGGTYYPVGAAMAKIWNKTVPGMKANAQSTGGTAQNIQLIGTGEAELGFTDGLYYFAYNGKQSFEGNPQKHLRGMVPLYPEPIHLMVASGSNIKSIKDLKGKRVGIGAVGSGIEYTARALLKIAGIDPDKDIRAENLGMGDTAGALADKNIDAGFMMGAIGSSAMVEVTTIGTGKLLPLEADLVKKLNAQLPYYTPFTIPANSYKGQTTALPVAATWNILSISEKVDAAAVYKMTKALFDNKKDLVNVSANMAFMNPKEVKVILIPLHPGAEKYFKEIGVIK
ncbi:MAG: TAXI family TRAP transporter solute-binding subunit [Synergistaceae bacterium]|nr:TAXI family TRAP transporter solute-binding subunit [Synergistaceae bacterium]MBP9626992.1 TAXI family TRAP transporter solute-binding subunit [Synergistaceae bacterium]MBP9958117.1 TAXI family TRAP transporter solute-binding subunit [Synergistaceae bacterium]